MYKNNKNKKGNSALAFFVSTASGIFAIGVLVMIYSLMGGQMKSITDPTSTINDSVAYNAINDTVTEVAGVPSYFGIFLIIAFLVTLVIMFGAMFIALRNAGILGFGGSGGF